MRNSLSYKFFFAASFIGCICFSLQVYSQNWGYKKYTTADGLMSNQIDAIYTDSKGLLWVANGNGITRYNGKTFVNYINDSVIVPLNKKINAFSIIELKDGSIFYSIKYGYVKTSDKRKYYLDIFLSDTLALENEDGVTGKNGIHYFKRGIIDFDFEKQKVIIKLFTKYPENRGIPSNILCSNKGNVFYSFYNKMKDTRTLFLYSEGMFKKICDDIGYIMSGIFETESDFFILPDEFTASAPIIIVNKKTLSKAYLNKNKTVPDIEFVGNGLFYQNKLIFPARNGIFILSQNKEQIFIKDNIMQNMKTSADERFLLSIYKPLYAYDKYIINGYRMVNMENQTIDVPFMIQKEMERGNFVKEAMPDDEGNVWYATFDGLFQIYPLPYEYQYLITDDYVGEVNDSIENSRFKCIKNIEKIQFCLTNDSERVQILIPEIKDIFYKYDMQTQKISPIYVQGLQSPILRERLYPLMSYKKIIVCQEYTRGLVIYHLNKTLDTAYYHLFNYSNGLLSNYVENVFVDKYENMWIITWDGIQIISYDDMLNENYEKAIRYSQSFKLDMIPFMKGDDIYFADALILYKIPTSKIIYNRKAPTIIVEKLTYSSGNKRFDLKFKQDSTYQVPYNFDEVSIDFYGVCLSDGSRVKYKYVIDKTMHYQSEGNIILTDLSYGKHLVELYASNNFNIWTKDPVRFYIEVLPPFWERWWFRITAVIGAVVMVVLIIRKREYDMRKKQLELEKLVRLRTKELEDKNKLIEKKNIEILDSIHYTKRLQQSSLPAESKVKKIFSDSFVLYMPKDIIAGDFYFCGIIRTNDGQTLKGISVGDCTGHGVPGAFMSILLLAYIKQSLTERDVNSPAEALEFVSRKIQKVLEHQNQSDTIKDSADMVFAVIDEKTNTLQCACANNPVYIVRNSELIEIPAQKRTVGYSEITEPFKDFSFVLQKGDVVYFFSAGYADQFGGIHDNNKGKNKKFTKKRFKDTLIRVASLSMPEQKSALLKVHQEWKSNSEQTDDICIVGIRV